jgi:ubiquinone/menaquinone biosynthesis C-methylase UbiE
MNAVGLSPDQRPDGWSVGATEYDTWFAPLSSRFCRNALELLNPRPGQRLLDVAAGTGALTLGAVRAGARVQAIDFAPGMVERLRANLLEAGLDAAVDEMDGQALAFADGEFDIACSMFGLIFFPDLDAGGRELCRVVRPGGQVLIAAWDRTGFPWPRAVEQAVQAAIPGFALPQGLPPALRIGDADSLQQLLASLGCAEAQVLEVTHDWAIADPVGLFRSIPHWAAPMRGVFESLTEAQIDQASSHFAELVADLSHATGGLPTTALFGHAIRQKPFV